MPSFCTTHDIPILNMNEIFVVNGRSRHNIQQNTNLHHYRIKLFYTVIDLQFQELNNCFLEANTNLLIYMACLNPSNSFVDLSKKKKKSNSFVAFDTEKLIRLAKFYPSDFSRTNILALGCQLQNYIFDMHSNVLFLEF